MKRIALFCLIFATLGAATPAWAYRYFGAKPLAMGGAFSAVANDVNAMQWNPAGLTFLTERKQMGFQFNYERQEFLLGDYKFLYEDEINDTTNDDFQDESFFDDSPSYDPDEKRARDWFHFAIADGYTNPFVTFGLSFTGMNFPNSTFQDSTDYSTDLTIAGGFERIFNVGMTARWVDIDPEGPGEFDADFGVLINAASIIGVGLVGRNVFGNDEPMIVRRELALGVAGFALEYAVISVEVTKVFDVTDVPGSFNFGAGVEGIIAKMFSLRGGYNWDQVSQARTYSLGAAYVDKGGTLAYTFQGDIDEVRDFTHSVELTLYFP